MEQLTQQLNRELESPVNLENDLRLSSSSSESESESATKSWAVENAAVPTHLELGQQWVKALKRANTNLTRLTKIDFFKLDRTRIDILNSLCAELDELSVD